MCAMSLWGQTRLQILICIMVWILCSKHFIIGTIPLTDPWLMSRPLNSYIHICQLLLAGINDCPWILHISSNSSYKYFCWKYCSDRCYQRNVHLSWRTDYKLTVTTCVDRRRLYLSNSVKTTRLHKTGGITSYDIPSHEHDERTHWCGTGKEYPTE